MQRLTAPLELLRYFRREGIPCLGDPYIEFHDLPDGPALVKASSLFGLMRLLRIATDGGRWFVQWWTSADSDVSTVNPQVIINLLENVVDVNRGRAPLRRGEVNDDRQPALPDTDSPTK